MRLIDRMRPNFQSAVNRSHAAKQRSFICGHKRIGRAASRDKFYNHGNVSCTILFKRRMHGHLEDALRIAFLWPHGHFRIKLTFVFFKSAVRHSQGSVGAPHGLENRRASDAQSVN